MTRVLLCCFCLILFLSSFSQVPGVQWQISDQNQQPRSLYPTTDSGAIVLASDLFKLDKKGKIQWRTEGMGAIVGKSQIFSSSDGGFFAVGNYPQPNSSASDFGIIKFSSTGNVLVRKSFGGSRDEDFASAIATSDGGCIIIGTTRSNDGDVASPQNIAYNAAFTDCWIIKVDALGELKWQKRVGGSGSDYARQIVSNGSGGYFIGCEVPVSDGDFSDVKSPKSWVVNLDDSGNIIWKKSYIGELLQDIRRTNDGNFLLLADTQLGSNYHYGGDIWMGKIDEAGTLLWEKCYGGSRGEYCDDANIQEDNEGNFYVAVSTYSNDGDISVAYGDQDVWVLKVDAAGDIIWQKTFGGAQSELADLKVQKNNEILLSVNTTSSNGIFAGAFSTTGVNYIEDTWLFKLDSNGNVLWQRLFGGEGDDWAEVQLLNNNEIFLHGISQSFLRPGTVGQNVLWITKIGPSNLIKATAFVDVNSNGVKDADEKQITNLKMIAENKNRDTITAQLLANGTFIMDVDTGFYSIKVIPALPYYTPVPSAKTTSFSSYFNNDSLSFALQPIPDKQDLTISVIPITPARPGYSATYQLYYENVGTTTIPSGEISFMKDYRVSLLSALPAESSASGNVLKWSYADFKPGDSASIFIQLSISAPPSVNDGDTLSYVAFIDPVASDETPANDSTMLKQVVVGSYDPNDKAENNGGYIPQSFVTNGDYLQYTIRFQNTGTDTAFNVAVRDTLSSRLDANTLEIVTASHPYSLSIDNGTNLTWKFDNILLPDDKTNEPLSHGYVVYRIRPKSDLMTGEVVHNTASIYFDFNLPVTTNDAPTQIQAKSIVLPLRLLNFYGTQLGSNVKLYWTTGIPDGAGLFQIERSEDGRSFTSIGSQRVVSNQYTYSFTDAHTPDLAYYRLKMMDANGSIQYSRVLRFQVKNSDKDLLMIYPNPLTNQAFVIYDSQKAGAAKLQLMNAAGVLIRQESVVLAKGRNVFELTKTARLAPGQYTLQIVVGNNVASQQLIVQ